MDSAYPPGDMPQHMAMPPPSGYPGMPHPVAGMDPYQQQHQTHSQPPTHQPPTYIQSHPPHPHISLHPHTHQQPPSDDNGAPRHIPAEESPQGHPPPAIISRVEEGSGRRYRLVSCCPRPMPPRKLTPSSFQPRRCATARTRTNVWLRGQGMQTVSLLEHPNSAAVPYNVLALT